MRLDEFGPRGLAPAAQQSVPVPFFPPSSGSDVSLAQSGLKRIQCEPYQTRTGTCSCGTRASPLPTAGGSSGRTSAVAATSVSRNNQDRMPARFDRHDGGLAAP